MRDFNAVIFRARTVLPYSVGGKASSARVSAGGPGYIDVPALAGRTHIRPPKAVVRFFLSCIIKALL